MQYPMASVLLQQDRSRLQTNHKAFHGVLAPCDLRQLDKLARPVRLLDRPRPAYGSGDAGATLEKAGFGSEGDFGMVVAADELLKESNRGMLRRNIETCGGRKIPRGGGGDNSLRRARDL